MLGTGLYHPTIDIEDPVWLRSAILFWNGLRTISPSSFRDPYRTDESRECAAEGYLQPLHCDLHVEVLDDLGAQVAKMLSRDSVSARAFYGRQRQSSREDRRRWDRTSLIDGMQRRLHYAGLKPEKMSKQALTAALRLGSWRDPERWSAPEVKHVISEFSRGRLHRDKLAYFLRDLGLDIFEHDADGEWLKVEPEFADAYLAAMASKLGAEFGLKPITPSLPAHEVSCRYFLEDMAAPGQGKLGALVTVTMEGLKVDPSTPISKLLKFRDKRADQYLELSQALTNLSEKIKQSTDVDDAARGLHEEARRIYREEIETQLRKLKRELGTNNISSAWDGIYRAITVSVPSAGALHYFTGLGGAALLGAGAAVTVIDVGVRARLNARKARDANRFSYLYDAEARFGLPSLREE